MTVTHIELHPISVDAYLELVGPDVIRVKGHRIGLEHIVERYQEGFSPEQIMLDFPGLELPQIYLSAQSGRSRCLYGANQRPCGGRLPGVGGQSLTRDAARA